MKRTWIATGLTGLMMATAIPATPSLAGEKEWATAGKILTGVFAVGILAELCSTPAQACASQVVAPPTVVVQETRVVTYTPPPQVIYETRVITQPQYIPVPVVQYQPAVVYPACPVYPAYPVYARACRPVWRPAPFRHAERSYQRHESHGGHDGHHRR